VAPKTGNTYISGTMTDRITIPTANQGFSTTPSATIATTNDKRNDNRKWTPILKFLVVDCCRNHLANLLLRSSSSKIPNLALDFRRYLSEFQRYNYFRFLGAISVFPVVGRCCTLLPILFSTLDMSLEF